MSDYIRTTRSLSLHQVPDDVMDAIRNHCETYNLGQILTENTICVETISDRKKKKKVGGIKLAMHIVNHVLLSDAWLVYVVSNDGKEPAAMTVPLVEATIEDYALSPFYKKIPDHGFWIHGKFTGKVGGNMSFSDRSSIFMGLGQERAAEEFGRALSEAIERTRR
jgi:hypothetical protein